MTYGSEHQTVCCAPDCDASFRGSKFDAIRASEEGWFFSKSGDAYCPEHVPVWVPAWRARQASREHS